MPDLEAALADSLLSVLMAEADWHQFLELLISDQSHAAAMFMMQNDRLSGSGGEISIVTGLEESAIRDYSEHYSRVNPWLPDFILHTTLMNPWCDQDVLPRAQLHRSEYYNDYLRPLGLEGAAGLALTRRDGTAVLLGVVLGDADPETPALIMRRIGGLMPVMSRVLDYYRRPDAGMLAADQVVEVLGSGLCLFGWDGRFLHLSRSAEALGQALDLFVAEPLGRVRLKPDLLQEARQEMLRWDYTGPVQRVIRLKDCRLTLFRSSRSSMSELLCGPVVGLIIEPMRSWLDPHHEHELVRRYRLTGAELRALRGIAAGASIQDMAESSGRSVETLRSQVKSLLYKTGCATQLQLLHLLRSL